ncbi:hypothetical protein CDAR_191371 [Caerostris darwini]|uniref:C2H2-type domain-containing protein n=1 Tax=Caerostris darwini TaxID=1538125 RepID=A0AAV4W8M5_9ARAC|nr:hypothetical protein CDAR_191371 [Caerostris darwini]
MAIWNCEFCNAYVTDFEVHYCRNFGNQQRQSSATLPRSSSANLVQDIDSRSALAMNCDEGRSVMGQINYSAQQSVLSDIHLRTSCEETATAEIPSQYRNANQNQYNPDISDYLFPNMAHGEETPSKTTPLTDADQHNPVHVAEPCILPGFQEAFGQRNTLINQLAKLPSASSHMECSGTFIRDETSTQFICDFHEGVNASTNLISQHYERSSEIPILVDQNEQYNPMDSVPPTDASVSIHSSNCPKEFLPEDHGEPRELSRSVVRPHACSYCDRTFSRRSHLTVHIRTHTGDKPFECKTCNKRFRQSSNINKHMRLHSGKTPYACTVYDKCFADSSSLTRHTRTHTGEKPECSESFADSSNLKRHIFRHAGEERSKCDFCGAEFASEDLLAAHKCKKNK